MFNFIYRAMTVCVLVGLVYVFKYPESHVYISNLMFLAQIVFTISAVSGFVFLWATYKIKEAGAHAIFSDNTKIKTPDLIKVFNNIRHTKIDFTIPICLVSALFGFVFLNHMWLYLYVILVINALTLSGTTRLSAKVIQNQIDQAIRERFMKAMGTESIKFDTKTVDRNCHICQNLNYNLMDISDLSGNVNDPKLLYCDKGNDMMDEEFIKKFSYDKCRKCCEPDLWAVMDKDPELERLMAMSAKDGNYNFPEALSYFHKHYIDEDSNNA